MEIQEALLVIPVSLRAASWYDTTLNHVVSILSTNTGDDGSPSRRKGSHKDEMRFRIFPLRERAPSSSETFAITLPRALVLHQEGRSENGFAGRRLPLLVKFSLDRSLVLLQTSSTSVRVAVLDNGSQHHAKHWTIDLASGDPNPVSTAPDALAKFRYAYQAQDDPILSGGVIWSDHGGSSQDLILVSKKAVLCYKVSLQRNHMSVTHTFPHPAASSVWWEPMSRALVVGSYGPNCHGKEANHDVDDDVLHMRTFLLHSTPKSPRTKTVGRLGLTLPRLELPPPDRLPVFATTSKKQAQSSRHQIALVSLYGQPCLVEASLADNSDLEVIFYWLKREKPQVIPNMTEWKLPVARNVNDQELVIGVVDNVLCLCLGARGLQVFCDVIDEEENEFLTLYTEQQANGGNRPQPGVFVAASLWIANDQPGTISPVALDVRRLSASIENQTSALSFLLRRRTLDARELALHLISTMVDARSSREQQRRCFDQVALAYAKYRECWDMDQIESLALAYECSLPRRGAEFRVWGTTGDVFGVVGSIQVDTTPVRGHALRNGISQSLLLDRLFLPSASHASETSLKRILSLVVEYAAALQRHGACPSSALLILTAALLWRLGCHKQLLYTLEATSGDDLSLSEARVVANMLCLLLDDSSGASDHATTALILNATQTLIKSDPCSLIAILLRRRHVSLAMVVCTRADMTKADAPWARHRARALFTGSDFFAAAIEAMLGQTQAEQCRLWYCLARFLQHWDPACLVKKEWPMSASRARRIQDAKEGQRAIRSGAKSRIKRRPSWIAGEHRLASSTSNLARSRLALDYPLAFIGLDPSFVFGYV